MAFFLKELGEMTGVEFYQLARLRTAVFVVEQACAYQEIDAIDAQAKHLWALDEDGQIVSHAVLSSRNKRCILVGSLWHQHTGAKRRPSSDQRSFASH